MSKRSTTCFKRNGEPLMEYDSGFEAEDSAQFVLSKFNNEMTPYLCDSCGKFHLVLKGKVPISGNYACTDRDGQPKDSYESEETADRQVDYLYRAKQIALRSYHCYDCNYWHLTSH